MNPIVLCSLMLAMTLAALQTAEDKSEGHAGDPPAITRGKYDPKLPTQAEELEGATILDIDRFRPTARIAPCSVNTLPRAEPGPKLSAAVEAAKAYSDSRGGIGLIVMLNGKIVHESYSPGVDADSKTTSFSMAKSILALLYGIAIEKGMISTLGDPVSKYLQEWSGDERGEITLRELLTMSSGLSRPEFLPFLLAPDIEAIALQSSFEARPGAVFSYTNLNSKLLATVLERQVNKFGYEGLPDFLQSELWCPVGNEEALLWMDEAGSPRGYAGIFAGLRDWARIGELIRNRGRLEKQQVVPASWIAKMAKPSTTNAQYGLHVWLGREWTKHRRYSDSTALYVIHSEPFADKDLIYFDGFGGQRVYVIPSKGLTIARTGYVNFEFDDSVLPNTLSRALE